MNYPAFFDKVPTLLLQDPLGEFLGAFDQGKVEICYYDCVKLAGHSCPTVASAYLLASVGLDKLYPEGLPQRGGVKVEMKAPKEEGVTGVIANVIGYIVGGNDEGGFKGIGDAFGRRNLLSYEHAELQGLVRLTRTDTNASVTLSSDTSQVPGSPQMMPLMQKAIQGTASDEEKTQFRALWQARVEAMLLDNGLQNKIITIHETKENPL